MARFGDLDTQYFDDAGDPLAYGRVYFYESGTTTPKTTYADVNNSIPNPNPVLLTAAGRQPNIFFDGVARAILTNSSDVQIAVRDPVGETATDFGDQWVATKIYGATDVVLGSDGVYYRSLVNGNQNNNPVTSSGFWTLLYSVEWNSGITYDVGAVVAYNNQQYQSLQASNIGNNPVSATTYWTPLNFAWVASATYSLDQNVVGTDGILYTSLQNSNTGNDPATSPAYWVGTSAAAAASATAAAASATAASASETAAAASETAAAASETAAAASESAAATSATNAATSASAASTSASNAATSETNAAASATAAASSATAASTSETNAAASASAASTSETNAAASATAAASSETAAASSASAASTSETNAAASASAASTSASNASTSETNAASSATSAASSATAAAGSATSAANSATDAAAKYDEFDDRYLGEKASDPTTDNDGNPLITGALYFNNVSDAMKVYDGAAWVNVAPVATSVTVSQISDYTGTATTLNYTSNLSSDAQTQLDAKAVYPSQTGNAGKYLTTDGSVASWGAVSAGATQFGDDPLTYSTNKLVGNQSEDAFELDSDRELVIIGNTSTPSALSCIVYNKTTPTWGTEASISSSDIYLGAIKIATDTVLIAYSDEITTLKFRVLTFSGTSITVNTEYTSTITSIFGQSVQERYGYGLFDCGTGYVVTYPAGSGSNNQIAVAVTVSGTTVTIGSENTIQASAQNIYTVSPASGYVAFATNDGANFKVLSYSISGTTLSSINSGTYASGLSGSNEYSYIGKTSGNHYLFKQNQATNMDLVVATFDGSYNVTLTGYAGFLGDDFNYGTTTAAIFDASNNAIVCTSDGITYVNIYNGNTTSVGTSIYVYNSNYAYATDDAIYVNSNIMRKKYSFNSGSLLEEAMNNFNVTIGSISSRSMSNGVVTNSPHALYNASSLHISNSQYMYSYRTQATVGLANTINRSDDSVVFTPMGKASSFAIPIAGITDARYGFSYDTATTNYYIQRVSL